MESVAFCFEEITVGERFVHFLGHDVGTANSFEHGLMRCVGFRLEGLGGSIHVAEVNGNHLKLDHFWSEFFNSTTHFLDFLDHFLLFLLTDRRCLEGLLQSGDLLLELSVFRSCRLLVAFLLAVTLGLTNDVTELCLDGVALFFVHLDFCTNGFDFSKNKIDLLSVLLVLALDSVPLVSGCACLVAECVASVAQLSNPNFHCL